MLIWTASQVAQRVTGLSIEQMGGVGFTRELGIEKYWRFAVLLSFADDVVTPRLEQFMKVDSAHSFFQGSLSQEQAISKWIPFSVI